MKIPQHTAQPRCSWAPSPSPPPSMDAPKLSRAIRTATERPNKRRDEVSQRRVWAAPFSVDPCLLSITIHPITSAWTICFLSLRHHQQMFLMLFPCSQLVVPPSLCTVANIHCLQLCSVFYLLLHLLKVCSSFKFPWLHACRCQRRSVEQTQAALCPKVCSIKAGKSLHIMHFSPYSTGVNEAISYQQ